MILGVKIEDDLDGTALQIHPGIDAAHRGLELTVPGGVDGNESFLTDPQARQVAFVDVDGQNIRRGVHDGKGGCTGTDQHSLLQTTLGNDPIDRCPNRQVG